MHLVLPAEHVAPRPGEPLVSVRRWKPTVLLAVVRVSNGCVVGRTPEAELSGKRRSAHGEARPARRIPQNRLEILKRVRK